MGNNDTKPASLNYTIPNFLISHDLDFERRSIYKHISSFSHKLNQKRLSTCVDQEVIQDIENYVSKLRQSKKYCRQLIMCDGVSKQTIKQTKVIYSLQIQFSNHVNQPKLLKKFLRKFTRINQINIHFKKLNQSNINTLSNLENQKTLKILSISFKNERTRDNFPRTLRLNPAHFLRLQQFIFNFQHISLNLIESVLKFSLGLQQLKSLTIHQSKGVPFDLNDISAKNTQRANPSILSLISKNYFEKLKNIKYQGPSITLPQRTLIKCKKLEYFHYSILTKPNFSVDANTNALNQIILNNKSLNSIGFQCTFIHYSVKDKFIQICPKITTLHLDNYFHSREAIDFQKQFPNLTSLSLSIYMYQKISRFPENLKKLILRFPNGQKYMNDFVQSLQDSIKSCQSLSALILDCESCHEDFWHGLQLIKTLKKLDQNLRIRVTERNFISILSSVMDCSNLQELNMQINIGGIFEKNESYYQLGIVIQNNSKTLQKLKVIFLGKFKDYESIFCFYPIKDCKNLEELFLCFDGVETCEEKGDQRYLKALLLCFQGMNYKKIKAFSLELNNIKLITEDMEQLFYLVNQMKLRVLSILFNQQITNPKYYKNCHKELVEKLLLQTLLGQPYLESLKFATSLDLDFRYGNEMKLFKIVSFLYSKQKFDFQVEVFGTEQIEDINKDIASYESQ